MTMREASEALQRILRSGLVAGLEITIFDPELDANGSIARAFTNSLVEALR
jgi:arginase family enzyme